VRSLPVQPTIGLLALLDRLNLSPLGPWHYRTYHKPFYFDSEPVTRALDWRPRHCNVEMLTASYDWFVTHFVLDHVARCYGDRPVLLAPANRFGSPMTEQAAAYLRARGMTDLVVAETAAGGYVDTRGNARACTSIWKGLVAGRSARRAGGGPPACAPGCALLPPRRLCARTGRCRGRATPRHAEPIVRRLWYYRWPWLHRAYETLALARDLLRPPAAPRWGADELRAGRRLKARAR
jgi:hypothetical protein